MVAFRCSNCCLFLRGKIEYKKRWENGAKILMLSRLIADGREAIASSPAARLHRLMTDHAQQVHGGRARSVTANKESPRHLYDVLLSASRHPTATRRLREDAAGRRRRAYCAHDGHGASDAETWGWRHLVEPCDPQYTNGDLCRCTRERFWQATQMVATPRKNCLDRQRYFSFQPMNALGATYPRFGRNDVPTQRMQFGCRHVCFCHQLQSCQPAADYLSKDCRPRRLID